MQKTRFIKSLSSVLCIVLTAAAALLTTGCNGSNTPSSDSSVISENTSADTSAAVSETVSSEISVLGEGEIKFDFTVTDQDGNESFFEIHTDKATVGEALIELGLLEGEESEYGLYVKKVNGITADYDTDGVYWAFYIDGEYAMSGVDSTKITDGSVYSFKVEK